MHHFLSGEGNKPGFKVLEKAQIGLPIIYNFREYGMFDKYGPPKGGKYEAKGVVWDVAKCEPDTDAKDNVNRRASPLLISCHTFKGIPYAVVCHFPSPILPNGQKIWLKSQNPSGRDYFPDPPTTYQFTEDLLINGRNVKKEFREPLCNYFDSHAVIFERKKAEDSESETANDSLPNLAEIIKENQNKTLKSDSVTKNSEKIPDDPDEMKKFFLSEAPPQKDGLQWFLAEIVKVERSHCSCILWSFENEKLRQDEQEWHAREKQLNLVPGLKRDVGNFFLCTKQPDNRTQNSKNYLYNITLPKRIV